MHAVYKHTNLIARDWRALAGFYERVFGCVPVPPLRNLRGGWLDRGTGLERAVLEGVHLRLPGHGEGGPTLEIFSYEQRAPRAALAANREGYGHLAFEVDDVAEALEEVLAGGGKAVGAVAEHEVQGASRLTFVYCADPEGNLIELQAWQ